MSVWRHGDMRVWLLSVVALALAGCQEQVRLRSLTDYLGSNPTSIWTTWPTISLGSKIIRTLWSEPGRSTRASATVQRHKLRCPPRHQFPWNRHYRTVSLRHQLHRYKVSVSLVTGTLDIRRLQILYEYALRGKYEGPGGFLAFRNALWSVGYDGGLERKDNAKFLRAYASFLPNLPDQAFAEFTPQCLGPNDFLLSKTLTFGLVNVCFRGRLVYGEVGIVSGERLASRLALWTLAIPQLGRAANQPGTSEKSGSSLVIPAVGR